MQENKGVGVTFHILQFIFSDVYRREREGSGPHDGPGQLWEPRLCPDLPLPKHARPAGTAFRRA